MGADVQIDAVIAILLAGIPVWILIGLLMYHIYQENRRNDK